MLARQRYMEILATPGMSTNALAAREARTFLKDSARLPE
jgi:hypothetical protein